MPEIQLSQLLEEYEPAYCDTWPEAFEYLSADPVEAHTIELLRQVLRKEGSFKDPIRLGTTSVGNGMHRIAAAVLEGVPALEFTTVDVEPGVGEYTAVYFHLVTPTYQGFDTLVAAFRSFPMAGRWVECIGFSSVDGLVEAVMDYPPEDPAELLALLGDIASQSGVPVKFTRTAPWPDEELYHDMYSAELTWDAPDRQVTLPRVADQASGRRAPGLG